MLSKGCVTGTPCSGAVALRDQVLGERIQQLHPSPSGMKKGGKECWLALRFQHLTHNLKTASCFTFTTRTTLNLVLAALKKGPIGVLTSRYFTFENKLSVSELSLSSHHFPLGMPLLMSVVSSLRLFPVYGTCTSFMSRNHTVA